MRGKKKNDRDVVVELVKGGKEVVLFGYLTW